MHHRVGKDKSEKQRVWIMEGIQCHTKWLRVDLISNREPLKIFEQRYDMSRDVTEEDLFGNRIQNYSVDTCTCIHTHRHTHTIKNTHILTRNSCLRQIIKSE